MEFEDLPDNVIHQILEDVPVYILYNLLKSKSCGKIAYEILYRAVLIDKNAADNFAANVHTRYEKLPNLNYGPHSREQYNYIPAFGNTGALVDFAESHPFFIPHTLCYNTISDLNLLHEAKPGILQQFKFFHKVSPGNGIAVVPKFDLASLKHRLFSTENIDFVPDFVQQLELYKHEPKEVMDSVESLVLHKDVHIEGDFRMFPNLKHLQANHFITKLILASPSLETIDFSEQRTLDIRSTTNLEQATSVSNMKLSLSNSQVVTLWKNLKSLDLCNVTKYQQLENVHQLEHLTKLGLFFNPFCTFVIDFLFPPNLEELKIFPEQYKDFNIPELDLDLSFLEPHEVTFSGIHLPKTMKHLDVQNVRFMGSDLTHLENLTSFTFNNKDTSEFKLPCGLKFLDLIDFHDCDIFKDLNKLEYLRHQFAKTNGLREVNIPGSVKRLFWAFAKIVTITGGENLNELGFNGCTVDYNLEKFSSLNRLFLKNASIKSPKFPPSLQSLILEGVSLTKKFTLPENLEYLEISYCNLRYDEYSVKSSVSLKAIKVIGTTCNMTHLLGNTGVCLEKIHLENCRIPSFRADLSLTSLSYFNMQNCQSKADECCIVFPKSLKVFKATDPLTKWKLSTYDFYVNDPWFARFSSENIPVFEYQ